ncbi:unnamed protein product [Closterium sp. NIES-54]
MQDETQAHDAQQDLQTRRVRETKNLLKKRNEVRPRPRRASSINRDSTSTTSGSTCASRTPSSNSANSSRTGSSSTASSPSSTSSRTNSSANTPSSSSTSSPRSYSSTNSSTNTPSCFSTSSSRSSSRTNSVRGPLDLLSQRVVQASLAPLHLWSVEWSALAACAFVSPSGTFVTPGSPQSAAPAQALHTFTLDSGASRCFFRDSTIVTPLPAPVPVSLADPSGAPVLARSSTVLPCPAVPSGELSGLHLPSFSTNLVRNAVLQDAGVDTFTPEPFSLAEFQLSNALKKFLLRKTAGGDEFGADAGEATWQQFREGLLQRFEPINAALIARDKIHRHRQIGSVANYTQQME